jgi:hypothetical protein
VCHSTVCYNIHDLRERPPSRSPHKMGDTDVPTSFSPATSTWLPSTTNGTIEGDGEPPATSLWVVVMIVAIVAVAACAVVLHCATKNIRSRRKEMRRAERAMMNARSAALEEVLVEFEQEEMRARFAVTRWPVDDVQNGEVRAPVALVPRTGPSGLPPAASKHGDGGRAHNQQDDDDDLQGPYVDEEDLVVMARDESVDWEQHDSHRVAVSTPIPTHQVVDVANDELLLAFSPSDIPVSAEDRAILAHGSIGPPMHRRSIPSASHVRGICLNDDEVGIDDT